jgi:hypothetical protein
MKNFSIILAIIFLSVSASCSMTEDIAPPPGYQSPTPEPNLGQVSPTADPTPTKGNTPPAATPQATLTDVKSLPSPAAVSAIPGALIANITGELIKPSASIIPAGQRVTLVGFDQDQSGSYQKGLQEEASVNADGSYSFTNVEVPLGRAFLLFTTWEDVEYQSNPLIISSVTSEYTLSITVYDVTGDHASLEFDQVHLIFGSPGTDDIQVTGLFVVTNPGDKAILVQTDGTTVPFIDLPGSARNIKFQLSQNSSELLNATGGFAMLPGIEKQYGFVASFSMPFKKNLEYVQKYSLPVASLTVFVPQGMRLKSDQLTDSGTQIIQSQTYQMYQSDNLGSGSSLSLKLSGKPGSNTGLLSDRQTLVVIGIGVVGLLLVGVGVYFFLYDRARARKSLEAEQLAVASDALAEDREAIMDAIIELDDQFAAGQIQQDVYNDRRKQLVERLKGDL